MIYTEAVKKAINIMYKKHENQIDKGGIPYVFHPWHIAEQMPDEEKTIVALLHDVIEDTDTTLEELKSSGFSDEIVKALELLAHNNNEDYFTYIKKLSSNEIARCVKLEDLKHNLDLTRLKKIAEKDLKRQQKYQECIKFLENIKS